MKLTMKSLINSGMKWLFSLADRIMNMFADQQYDEIKIIYNQFRNAAIQDLTVDQYLPVLTQKSADQKAGNTDYIMEPSQEYH
jgi:F-type H+-transporting ATPase subunit gamma